MTIDRSNSVNGPRVTSCANKVKQEHVVMDVAGVSQLSAPGSEHAFHYYHVKLA